MGKSWAPFGQGLGLWASSWALLGATWSVLAHSNQNFNKALMDFGWGLGGSEMVEARFSWSAPAQAQFRRQLDMNGIDFVHGLPFPLVLIVFSHGCAYHNRFCAFCSLAKNGFAHTAM